LGTFFQLTLRQVHRVIFKFWASPNSSKGWGRGGKGFLNLIPREKVWRKGGFLGGKEPFLSGERFTPQREGFYTKWLQKRAGNPKF